MLATGRRVGEKLLASFDIVRKPATSKHNAAPRFNLHGFTIAIDNRADNRIVLNN